LGAELSPARPRLVLRRALRRTPPRRHRRGEHLGRAGVHRRFDQRSGPGARHGDHRRGGRARHGARPGHRRRARAAQPAAPRVLRRRPLPDELHPRLGLAAGVASRKRRASRLPPSPFARLAARGGGSARRAGAAGALLPRHVLLRRAREHVLAGGSAALRIRGDADLRAVRLHGRRRRRRSGRPRRTAERPGRGARARRRRDGRARRRARLDPVRGRDGGAARRARARGRRAEPRKPLALQPDLQDRRDGRARRGARRVAIAVGRCPRPGAGGRVVRPAAARRARPVRGRVDVRGRGRRARAPARTPRRAGRGRARARARAPLRLMAAPERQRDPDAEFVGTFREPPAFEDLSERMAVKLTSMLRLTGPPHYELWQREIGGPHFKERTGQFLPIYHLDVEVTDAPIETRQMLDVAVRIRLGKEIGADGRVERLLSEADTELTAPTAAGGRVRLGRTRKQSIFTRADPDPARRRVTTLHPSFGLGELPRRELRAVKPDELLAPPADGRHLGALGPGPSHAWSYQQTDPNRHVHAMEYLRVVEAFATTELARAGRLPADY